MKRSWKVSYRATTLESGGGSLKKRPRKMKRSRKVLKNEFGKLTNETTGTKGVVRFSGNFVIKRFTSERREFADREISWLRHLNDKTPFIPTLLGSEIVDGVTYIKMSQMRGDHFDLIFRRKECWRTQIIKAVLVRYPNAHDILMKKFKDLFDVTQC